MKKVLLALTVGLVFTVAYAQADNPLKKGMPNTVTLPNGEVIYDLSGEWNAIYNLKRFGISKDIVKITQNGNKFVGIKLIGNEYLPEGSETIKGELGINGFKYLYMNTELGWREASGTIDDKCNQIVISVPIFGITIDLTLTRK